MTMVVAAAVATVVVVVVANAREQAAEVGYDEGAEGAVAMVAEAAAAQEAAAEGMDSSGSLVATESASHCTASPPQSSGSAPPRPGAQSRTLACSRCSTAP